MFSFKYIHPPLNDELMIPRLLTDYKTAKLLYFIETVQIKVNFASRKTKNCHKNFTFQTNFQLDAIIFFLVH